MRLKIDEAKQLARQAAIAAGAGVASASSLADATIAAELSGHGAVGFAHLPDYLDGFRSGRIATNAQPEISQPTPTTIRVDARGGIAQLGFDQAFDILREQAQRYGLAMFAQSNSYTAGELGYYTRRLAEVGLVSIAASNGPAMVTTAASRLPVFGTNPFSFAAPVANGSPLVIDQASSATAFVNLRAAAENGESIPEQWALDAAGAPTTNAHDALSGVLLAFGGARGANIALMVEVLAAGLTGANWSLDMPSFDSGDQPLGAGLFVLAITPEVLAPDLPARVASQLERLAAKGLYIPGQRPMVDEIEIEPLLLSIIERG
ncbi:Ldh family oxidoreductase [Aquipseudomonas campi]